jgi:hypothetical protein
MTELQRINRNKIRSTVKWNFTKKVS